MSATQLAQTAYRSAAAPIRTDRSAEYGAFETVTSALARAAKPGAKMPAIAAAIYDNRRLWTVLTVDLASPDNGLPDELRAQLLYLAEFSLLHSRKALQDPSLIEPLIDVNRSVMRGLDGIAGPT